MSLQDDAEYTPREELAHALTHGFGVALAAIGLVLLLVLAAGSGTMGLVATSVFGATLVFAYVASTVYHALPSRLRAKRVWQRLDHAAIHLLIAGTYTPFTLLALGGSWGWTLFGVVWGLAALGLVVVATPLARFRRASLVLYLAMGWLAVVAIVPLVRALPLGGLVLLVAGGLAYTLGVPFYLSTRRFAHAIWHGFVLAGSACHVAAVALYVLPS